MMCVTDQEIPAPRILIVEDSGALRGALREWLAVSFPAAQLFEAASGEEAVVVIRREAPDLVLMDIGLPGMDGIEATRQIKGQSPETRVVVLTIHEDAEYRTHAAAAGACAFVPKRTMRADLMPLLRTLCGPEGGETGASGRGAL